MEQKRTDQFIKTEDGGGTVFSVFVFMCLCVLLGIMVDATNAWRNSTILASAADMGSHAGAVVLANDGTEEEALAAARAQVRRNISTQFYGDTVGQDGDVFLLSFDPETRSLSTTGPRNAVAVRTNRLAERNNGVGTFLLNFAGVMSWDVREVSVTAYEVSTECRGTDGIFSESRIRASAQNRFGTGYCVHSNDHVWLPQQNEFAEGTLVSMPDLADCGNKCSHDANPGISATEVNMIFPDFGDYIQATYNAFNNDGLDDPDKAAFFAGRALGDLNALREAGILGEFETADVGDLIPLSLAEFHALERLPAGLVYRVLCASGGNGPSTRLSFSATSGQMRDAALLTNCSLDFQDGTEVEGGLIVTTRNSSTASVSAGEEVTVGDSVVGTCSSSDRSTIMSMSGVSVPAKFAASNVTMIVDDTVDIASSSSSGDTSYGLTIYATDRVDISSQHTFISCGEVDEVLVPRGKVIRHVATN